MSFRFREYCQSWKTRLKCCLELLKDYHKVQYPISQNDFSLILKYKLLNKQPESLVRYVDVSPEIAFRIANQLNNFFNYKQFCDLLKTRELTQTRVNRALLHIMLGTKRQMWKNILTMAIICMHACLVFEKTMQSF